MSCPLIECTHIDPGRMIDDRSYSDEPGYNGHPKYNSATTQPNDHISIASQNGKPAKQNIDGTSYIVVNNILLFTYFLFIVI